MSEVNDFLAKARISRYRSPERFENFRNAILALPAGRPRWNLLDSLSWTEGADMPELPRLFVALWAEGEPPRFQADIQKLIGVLLPRQGELFSPEDRATFDALPGTITIFRSCEDGAPGSRSWTVSEDIAARAARPVILTRRVRKLGVLFYRNEGRGIILKNPAGIRGSAVRRIDHANAAG